MPQREGEQQLSASSILQTLALYQTGLRRMGVRKIGLFGSYRRGAPTPKAISIFWLHWKKRPSTLTWRSRSHTMQPSQLSWITNFIWGIADDVLRDLYVHRLLSQKDLLILPPTLKALPLPTAAPHESSFPAAASHRTHRFPPTASRSGPR